MTINNYQRIDSSNNNYNRINSSTTLKVNSIYTRYIIIVIICILMILFTIYSTYNNANPVVLSLAAAFIIGFLIRGIYIYFTN